MKALILELVEEYIISVVEKIKENPQNSFIAIIAFIIAVPTMSKVLLASYGLFTHIAYVIACVYGFSRIIANPYRPLIWGVGFALGAVATDLIFSTFIPTISGGDWVSVFSGLVILFVIIMVYLKSKELKNS